MLRLCIFSIILFGIDNSVYSGEPIKGIGKYLTVNYKPFFPIGLYSFPDRRQDDAMWKEAADAGFNFILSEESGRHGMYVARKVPDKTINGQKVSLMELYRDSSLLPDLLHFLAKNETDSTILCWHAPDEPSWFGPSANSMQLGYEAIRDNSKKPVWLNVGPSFTQVWHYNKPRDMMRACDILSEDIYPIPEGKAKPNQGYNRYAYFVGEHTKQLVDLGSIDGVPNKPVWMVLQGFGWGDLGPANDKSMIPPTKHELRYMVYDAIVHGATGILWWGLRTTKTETGAETWKDLKTMASELRELNVLWTCPFELLPEKVKITYEGNNVENPVHCLIKLLNDKVFILAVNTRNVPLKNVTFSVTSGGGVLTKVQVLNENREVTVSDKKSWSDKFDGYGVHIYETDIYFSFMRKYYKDPTLGITDPANK